MDLKTQNSEAKRSAALIMRVRFIKSVQWKQICVQICLNEGKVKGALLYRLCTGRTAQTGSTGIALLFLDHGNRRG